MVPSGNCHCGNVGLYYAGGEHFCADHKTLAVDTARTRQAVTVGRQQSAVVHRGFRFGEDSLRLNPFATDSIFRRRIDRPSYNL